MNEDRFEELQEAIHPTLYFKLVEREILKLGDYNTAKATFSRYGRGYGLEEDQWERLWVIMMAEIRKALEKYHEDLPEDEEEAKAKVASKRVGAAPKKKAAKKKAAKVVQTLDNGDEIIDVDD